MTGTIKDNKSNNKNFHLFITIFIEIKKYRYNQLLMDYTTYLIGNIIFIVLLYWVVKNKNNW